MTSVIELITSPHPFQTLQARLDFAEVWGREVYEKPWYYRDTRDGITYYDLVGCIGWPDEVTEKGEGQPGYLAVIGIIRPLDADEARFDAQRGVFHVLEEFQTADVPTLLHQCVALRVKYGFGVNKGLMAAWYGDPDRFTTSLALYNEQLTMDGGEDNALVVAPPDDYVLKNRFEVYLRALKSVLQNSNQRLYAGKNEVLRNRIRGFSKNDPCITAMGGLVHTLLGRTMWMGQREEDNAFELREVL